MEDFSETKGRFRETLHRFFGLIHLIVDAERAAEAAAEGNERQRKPQPRRNEPRQPLRRWSTRNHCVHNGDPERVEDSDPNSIFRVRRICFSPN